MSAARPHCTNPPLPSSHYSAGPTSVWATTEIGDDNCKWPCENTTCPTKADVMSTPKEQRWYVNELAAPSHQRACSLCHNECYQQMPGDPVVNARGHFYGAPS